MQDLIEDIGFALRNFRKSVGVVLLIVVTLGLGIGANSAIFSMVYHVLLGPLPFADGDQLVKIHTNRPAIGQYNVAASVQTMFDYERQSQTLSDVIEYHQMSFTLLGHGDPSFVQTGVISWDYFNVLGIQPILGRAFLPGEDEPGAEPLIILSNRYWYEKFGGDPNVVGTTLQMNNAAHRVIGVLPPMPAYPMDNDIWIGASTCPARGTTAVIDNRALPFVQAYGKIKPEMSFEQANADITSIVQRLSSQYPDSYPVEQGFSANLSPLRTEMAGDSSGTFYLLLGLTGLVLLIACANVANLNLVRMASREQEFAIREALGATPGRIARQVLTESVLLALAGGVLGLLVAWFGIGILADFATRYTPLASEVRMDMTVLLFCLAVAVMTGLISGSAAAMQRRNLNQSLKESGGNITTSSASKRMRQGLLITQFALAFIILTSAALVSLSLYRLSTEDPGFRTERVLSADLTLNFSSFTTNARRQEFLRYLEDTLAASPQINGVGASSTVPLKDTPTRSQQIRIEGHSTIDNTQDIAVFATSVSRDYFSVLDIPLISGRYFLDSDDSESPPVVLMNEAMVNRYFANESPIGKRVSTDGGVTWSEIVGVVGDSRAAGLDAPAIETLYAPYLQFTTAQFSINRMNLFIETADSSNEMKNFIADTIHFFDADQAITSIVEMNEIRDSWLSAPRLITQLITLFALLAFAITLSGVVGVVSYNISQRLKEIGIRMALGANPQSIRTMLTTQGMLLAIAGLLIGVVAMVLFAPALSRVLYATSPIDPLVYGGTAILIVLMAILAISLPTNKAVRIDPSQALRNQ
ncbi:MAG: ABC transporter permease [Pseudomonadota bacterium]